MFGSIKGIYETVDFCVCNVCKAWTHGITIRDVVEKEYNVIVDLVDKATR